MAKQRESKLIADPFNVFLKSKGWHVENIHGNQYQMGLPDVFICHHSFRPIWVEYKVKTPTGAISLTSSQKVKFPLLLSMGVPIYIIASDDLRGVKNISKREQLYKKLFEEPNAYYGLNNRTMRLL